MIKQIHILSYTVLRRCFSCFIFLMAFKAVHLGINPNQYSFLIQDCPKAKITFVFSFSQSSKYALRFLEHDAASLGNWHKAVFTTHASWTIPPLKWDQNVVSKRRSHLPSDAVLIPEEQRPQKLSNPFCFHYSQVVRACGRDASCVTSRSFLSCGITLRGTCWYRSRKLHAVLIW